MTSGVVGGVPPQTSVDTLIASSPAIMLSGSFT
jgi:hypothetical protein